MLSPLGCEDRERVKRIYEYLESVKRIYEYLKTSSSEGGILALRAEM